MTETFQNYTSQSFTASKNIQYENWYQIITII